MFQNSIGEVFSNPNNQAIIQGIGVIITALATIVLALLTRRYVRLTNYMLEETRASRGPNIYVDLEIDSYGIKLIVGNSGSSPACNIRFKVSDSIPWRESKHFSGLNNLQIIKEGLSYLAPNRVLKYRAGRVAEKELFNTDSKAEFIVTYEDNIRKNNKLEFLIDIGQYKEVLFESFQEPESKVAEAINMIVSHIRSEKTRNFIFQSIVKRNCPFCGESISPSAKKCPHCLEFIQDKENK